MNTIFLSTAETKSATPKLIQIMKYLNTNNEIFMDSGKIC